MTPVKELECGTYGAYQRHVRRRETPCDACRAANREYQQQIRTRPGNAARERRWNAARGRALWRLANEYPERFRQLYLEEVGQ